MSVEDEKFAKRVEDIFVEIEAAATGKTDEDSFSKGVIEGMHRNLKYFALQLKEGKWDMELIRNIRKGMIAHLYAMERNKKVRDETKQDAVDLRVLLEDDGALEEYLKKQHRTH